MSNDRKERGMRRTRFFSLLIGFLHIDFCLLLSIFSDIDVMFLYKMAALIVGLSGLYITGRSATHFVTRDGERINK